MSRPRKRMFGPLFYSTLVASVLVIVYAELVIHYSTITKYLQEQSLLRHDRALIAELRSDDPKVRNMAVQALLRSRSKALVPYLLEAAHDSRRERRILACQYLTELDVDREVLVPVLVAAANDGEEMVRFMAALAFGRIRSQRMSLGAAAPTIIYGDGLTPALRSQSYKALRSLLKDKASATRVAAADALALLGGDQEVIADLVLAAGDPERDLRFAAARALFKIRGPDDATAGRTLVALIGSRDPVGDRMLILQAVVTASPEVRDQAMVALASLLTEGDLVIHQDVIDCLVAAGPLARPARPALERLLNDKDPEQRTMAAIAVARIEGKISPRTLAILLSMIEDVAAMPVEKRQSIIDLIRELSAADLAKATPILIRQLGSPNPEVRIAAHEMLGGILGDTPAEMPASNPGK